MQQVNDGNDDAELNYRLGEELIERWRRGSDLEFLVDLLRSEKSGERLLGAYYLGEVGGIDGLKGPAIELADDVLSSCRRAFVDYVRSSGCYDGTIADGLAKCLLDIDLYVRVTTMKWAIATSDEIFEQFSLLVESGDGGRKPRFPNPLSNDFWNRSTLKRATRGLDIIRRLRAGQKIKEIREDFLEEDSFVLDNFLFWETRRERDLEWRKTKAGH
ncbi:hypothetical protein EB235_16355 [Mesorhizobium loti R88b]|uniref:HEAT repeat domain-containing protein n=2 Tax=Rhizobium loti TaxID=381 RepID=A0A6M7WQD4_RHILI|nr:hypothetical protein EB235_16355 [Mesorhizobium loti R88b]